MASAVPSGDGRVIAIAQGGSVKAYDGQMIDRPVVIRAQAILSRGSEGIWSDHADLDNRPAF